MRPLLDADIRLCKPGFVPLCRRACLGGAFLLSFTFSRARLLSARDLQHRTWRPRWVCRLRCCLLQVGRRHVLDLAASHRQGHLCLSLHLWSHDSVLRNLDQLLNLFDITSTKKFPGCPHSTWDMYLAELEMHIRLLLSLKSHAPCATERQCPAPKAVTQSCW